MRWFAMALLVGCGPSVAGDLDAIGGSTDVSIELPGVEELEGATTLSHYQLTGLLWSHTREVEDEDGGIYRLVDYDAMLESPEAQLALADYLTVLATVDPAGLASRDEKVAYYINAYNAWVLQAVLGALAEDPEYRVDDNSFGLFNSNFIQVAGWEISPNYLEHALVRGQEYNLGVAESEDPALADFLLEYHEDLWGSDPIDARIHVGVNCASMSCPNLGVTAFTAATLDEQLDALATDFADSVNKGAGPDGLSYIFNWYGVDFVDDFGSVADFLDIYRSEGTEDVNFDAWLEYDWELNGADRW